MDPIRKPLSPDQEAARAALAAADRARLCAALRDAVAELVAPHHFLAWLQACRLLPYYSPANVLLIASQARCRGLDPATAAPARVWARLGYRVRADERPLLIRRPIRCADDDGRAHEDGPPARGDRVVNVRAGRVFCDAQVELIRSRPQLPFVRPAPAVPGRAFRRELARLEASLAADGWTVSRADLSPFSRGAWRPDGREFLLDAALEPDSQLYALVRGIAYTSAATTDGHTCATRSDIAAAAAFIVCARVGLDLEAGSVPHAARWAGGDLAGIDRDAREINRIVLALEPRLRDHPPTD